MKRPQGASAGPSDHNSDIADRDFVLDWIAGRIGPAERRQVMLLAVRFSPAPEIDDDNDPEHLAADLAWRTDHVTDVLSRYGGKLLSTGLDVMLAAWGWPAAHEDDALLATSAALELVTAAFGPLVPRCAIDCAIALVTRQADLAGGPPLITSATGHAVEMLANCEAGAVVVSAATRRLVETGFKLKPRQVPLEDNGASGLWLVTPELESCGARLPSNGDLVGRGEQLRSLLRAFDAANATRRGAMVLIEGPAGFGKSALLAGLRSRLSTASHDWLEFRCVPGSRSWSGKQTQIQRCETEDSTSVVRPFVPETLALLTAFIESTRADDATTCRVVVIEDGHWADADSIATLQQLARSPSLLPRTLVVVTSRFHHPEIAAALPDDGIIRLPELDGSSIETMLAGRSFSGRLHATPIRFIAGFSDGSPLNACALADMNLEPADDGPHRRLLSQSPNRINPGLATELDRLGPLKPLAQAAAISGQEFDTRLLATVLEIDARVLSDRISWLAGKSIVSPADTRHSSRYKFISRLTWSYCYASVPSAQRQRMHASFADALISAGAVRPKDVAHHLSESGNHARAFVWWHEAVLQSGANEPAHAVIAMARKALAAARAAPQDCPPDQVADLLSCLGNRIAALEGAASNEARRSYRRAAQVLAEVPEQPQTLKFDINWGTATAHLARGDLHAALEASTLMLESADEAVMPAALRLAATIKLHAGLIGQAVTELARAATAYDPHSHGPLRSRYRIDPAAGALSFLAFAKAVADDRAGSAQAERDALRLAARIDHPPTSSLALCVLATAAQLRRDHQSAAAIARIATAYLARHATDYWRPRARMIQGWVVSRRDPVWGLAIVSDVLRHCQSASAGRASIAGNCLLASIALEAGQPALSLEALRQVRERDEIEYGWLYAAKAMRLEAIARHRLGIIDSATAANRLCEATDLATRQGAHAFARRAARSADRLRR